MLRSQPHDSDADRLTEAALHLKPKQRVRLVERLMASLEPEEDPGAKEAWEREIARRVSLVKSGKAKFVTWDEIRRSLVSTRARKS